MPIYEYKCDNCGHEFEIWQSIKVYALANCPKCKKRTLKRLISRNVGVIFKGEGWPGQDIARKGDTNVSES